MPSNDLQIRRSPKGVNYISVCSAFDLKYAKWGVLRGRSVYSFRAHARLSDRGEAN